VEALNGAFLVRTNAGLPVASIPPGRTVDVTPTSSETVELTGKLIEKNGHFLLTDEVSQVVVELRGGGLAKLAGKRIQISGRANREKAVEGASQVIEVNSAHSVAGAKPAKSIIAGSVIATAAGVGLGVGLTGEEPRRTTSR
jgi:hypothetical protein